MINIVIVIIVFYILLFFYLLSINKFTNTIEPIRIQFTDFFTGGFEYNNNFITTILNRYNIQYIVVDTDPDYLIYGSNKFGSSHYNIKPKNKKIFFTGEPDLDSDDADTVLGFLPNNIINNKIYINMNLYELYSGLAKTCYSDLNNKRKVNDISKKKFCCFIVSNGGCKERNDFFDMLSSYKMVDSLGRFKKNVDINIDGIDMIDVISDYKFIICFENVSLKYYMTEKLYHAMKSSAIPIYWGNENCGDFFNKDSFIYVETKENYNEQIEQFNKTIDYIKMLDNNNDLYFSKLNQPNVLNPAIMDKEYNIRLENISKIFVK